MFITEALQQKVDSILNVVEQRADWLIRLAESEGWEEDCTRRWAAERALHVAIECVTDAANEIIDALVMREPGSYADIVKVLAEEGVVTDEWFNAFAGALQFRGRLVHHYRDLRPDETVDAVRRYAPLLKPYCDAVRRYLGLV